MRRRLHLAEITLIIVGTVASGTLTAAAAGGRSGGQVAARPEAMAGSWGQAIEIPGLSALNTGGGVQVNSLSCGSSGNCAVGGSYRTGSGQRQAFVASEENGNWESAIEVPGPDLLSLSCASAGNCVAGGYYQDKPGNIQAFVVSERNGTWGKVIEVPGSAVLNARGLALVNSVSCATVRNCAAGGFASRRHEVQGFVVSKKNGTWGQAIAEPGSGSLFGGRHARVFSA